MRRNYILNKSVKEMVQDYELKIRYPTASHFQISTFENFLAKLDDIVTTRMIVEKQNQTIVCCKGSYYIVKKRNKNENFPEVD